MEATVNDIISRSDPKPQVIYRCKKCRRMVASEEHIVSHIPGEGQKCFKWKKRSSESDMDPPECSSIFVEPMKWMQAVDEGCVGDKLQCMGCKARLGSFNWAGNMDVEGVLAMRRKNKGITSSSRKVCAKPDSSVRRPPPSTVEEGVPPRPRPKGDGLDNSDRGGGLGTTPPPKRTKPTDSTPIRHEKGKQLCPHLTIIDPSKDLWCHPELGPVVTRHNIRDADIAYVKPLTSPELMNSVFSDLARIPVVIQTLGDRATGYEEMQAKAEKYEEKCHSLTRELAQLKLDRDASRNQLEEQLSEVKRELKVEIGSGRRFLETLGGQRLMMQEADKAISRFKRSAEFTGAVQEASIPAFDACLDYCRKRLIDSGRFPGEKFEFLDPDWVEMIEGDSATDFASQGSS